MEPNIVELDVRPHLSKKLEPFELIMSTVKKLGKDDMFVLHAPFKPTPLLGVLKLRGLVNRCEKIAPDHWKVTFVHRSRKKWLGELDTQEEEQDDTASLPADLEVPAAAATASAAAGDPTYVLDNRGLQPPQPMMRTLAKVNACKSGESVLIHNDRVPVFLIEELKAMGCEYIVYEQPDGSAKVRITKP